jgi:DHA2 family multidrug resistance protein
MLEEGQQHDWFDSPLIITMAVISLIGLTLFIWQELTTGNPAVDLRVLRYRSLVGGQSAFHALGYGALWGLVCRPYFCPDHLEFYRYQNRTASIAGLLGFGSHHARGGSLIWPRRSPMADCRWGINDVLYHVRFS